MKNSMISYKDLTGTAIQYAKKAAQNGTFAVGGVLIDNSGNLLMPMRNKVIENGAVVDPTAHVERQLIDWYYDQKSKRKKMPDPNELTIISILDPCAMCTGAILTSGINVICVAFDDLAGINFNGKFDFPSLNGRLKERLMRQFSYAEIMDSNNQVIRHSFGKTVRLPDHMNDECFSLFIDSAMQVRNTINTKSESLKNRSINPKSLSSGSTITQTLKKYDSFSLDCQTDNFQQPDEKIASLLLFKDREAHKNQDDFNSAAFIDRFGNVLLCVSGKENLSPIRTPMMELIRTYTRIQLEAGVEGKQYLPHLKEGTILLLKGPGNDGPGLMDLGAYGSAMEGDTGENTTNFQYILPTQSPDELTKAVATLPPYYTESVRMNPMQVSDKTLINACKTDKVQ